MAGLKLDEHRVAVVTGGASGIGAAIVDTLLARGVEVAVLDVDEGALKALADRVTAKGRRVKVYPCDVADWTAVETAADQILADLGRVDVLCANAGVAGHRTPLWRQDPAEMERVLRVNVLGVTNAIRAFVPQMVERRAGHVAVTGSYLAFVTRSGGGNAAYASTKHADLAICEVLAEEFAHLGIPVGVSIVAPGPVATPLQATATTPADSADAFPPAEKILDFVAASDVATATVLAIEEGRSSVLVDAATTEYVRMRMTGRLESLTSA
ncbi:SDR family NAD(P)-dependent oxidoreductase [Streptomyces hygroscopicus]|uniref:SDR family NAD(P)-dependent oxidoreductase n=1 Tax=Streptomyces hygroscopicus TaxID=1912 RepID=UPI0033DAEF18